MTQLWLLEDLEPFPHPPVVGDIFTPTTFWLDAGSVIYESPIPTEICTRVSARVEPRSHDDHTEWVAEFDGGFQTMLPGADRWCGAGRPMNDPVHRTDGSRRTSS